MRTAPYIPLHTLCTLYKVERSFFKGLNDNGLIEIITIEQAPCIHHDQIKNLDAIVRLHQDLHINFEGIDTVLNLLDKITQLQEELRITKNRLRIFED